MTMPAVLSTIGSVCCHQPALQAKEGVVVTIWRAVLFLLTGVSSRQVRGLALQYSVPVLPTRHLQLLLGRTHLQDLPAWDVCSNGRVPVL